MSRSKTSLSPGYQAFLAAIIDEPDPAATAAFAASILGEDTGYPNETCDEKGRRATGGSQPSTPSARDLFIAAVLREHNFNPNEPRDERGRWTTGGPLEDWINAVMRGDPAVLGTPGSSRDDHDAWLDAIRGLGPKTSGGLIDNQPNWDKPGARPDIQPNWDKPGARPDNQPNWDRPGARPDIDNMVYDTKRDDPRYRLEPCAASADDAPFMSDQQYNRIVENARRDNPPDPDGTPADKKAVTIAILVETQPGEAIGHTAIAISKPGVGFDPAKMRFYDFGPADHKNPADLRPVAGAPWWGSQARDYKATTETGAGVPATSPKLSDVLRDLPALSGGSDVHMVVTQVTADQGRNIEAFWKNTMYHVQPDGQPNVPEMPKYTFDNSPTTYNCTSSTYSSLLAASNGGAGDVLGWALARKVADFTKVQAANPSMFLNLLTDQTPYPKGSGLKRTAGNTSVPVSEFEWTPAKSKAQGNQPRWVQVLPDRK